MQTEKKFIENLLLNAWKMSSECITNTKTRNVKFFEFLGEWPSIRKYDLKKNGIIDDIINENIVNKFLPSFKYNISKKVRKNSFANLEIVVKKYKMECLQLFFFTDGWSFNSYIEVKKLKNLVNNNVILQINIPSISKSIIDRHNFFYEIMSSRSENENTKNNDTFYKFIVSRNEIKWWYPNMKQDISTIFKHTNGTVYYKNYRDNDKTIKSLPLNITIGKDIFLSSLNNDSHRSITKINDNNIETLHLLNKKFPNPRSLPVLMYKKIIHNNDTVRKKNTSIEKESNCKIDIAFLIDLSFKTKIYLGDYLHSILVILSKAVISQTKIQVSVVSFSSHKNQSILFNFGKQSTLLSISEKLNYLVNDNDDDNDDGDGSLNIKKTLTFLYKFFTSPKTNNLRPSAHKKVVILTQGYFSEKQNILGELKKLEKINLEIFCIGIKKAKNNLWIPRKEELLLIATNQKNVAILSSFPDRIFVRRIIPAVCKFEVST